MNLDDETLLTAYLDGELEADELRRVESALRTAPARSDRLHELASVRDLVASLPRPALAIDLTATVCVELEARARRSRLRSPGTLARLALAASVLIAFGLGLLADGPKPRPAPRPVEASVSRAHPAPSLVGFPRVRSRTEPRASDPRPGGATVAGSQASKSDAERARIRSLLERPDVRRIFVIADVLGGESSARVDALVENTPRVDSTFGRIAVGQGILIDPEHPNEAVVYALVMDDRELKQFRTKLSAAFPEAVEEGIADARVVAQLGDVGRVAVLPGTPAATLERPAETPPRIALKDEPRLAVEPFPLLDPREMPGLDLIARAERFEVAGEPTPEQERSAPGYRARAAAPNLARANAEPVRDDTTPRPRERPVGARGKPPSLVLVWVTTRAPHAQDRH